MRTDDLMEKADPLPWPAFPCDTWSQWKAHNRGTGRPKVGCMGMLLHNAKLIAHALRVLPMYRRVLERYALAIGMLHAIGHYEDEDATLMKDIRELEDES